MNLDVHANSCIYSALFNSHQMVDKLQIKTLDTINSMRHQGQASPEDEAVLDVAERVCRDAENAKQLLPKLQAVGMQWEAPGNPIEQVGGWVMRLGK